MSGHLQGSRGESLPKPDRPHKHQIHPPKSSLKTASSAPAAPQLLIELKGISSISPTQAEAAQALESHKIDIGQESSGPSPCHSTVSSPRSEASASSRLNPGPTSPGSLSTSPSTGGPGPFATSPQAQSLYIQSPPSSFSDKRLPPYMAADLKKQASQGSQVEQPQGQDPAKPWSGSLPELRTDLELQNLKKKMVGSGDALQQSLLIISVLALLFSFGRQWWRRE